MPKDLPQDLPEGAPPNHPQEAPEAEAAEYSIDEVAALASIPSRTIRYYQSQGLLTKPRRKGRRAYYSDDHLKRIELIGNLRDRGFQLSAIRDLFEQQHEVQLSVHDWLGLSERLEAPWSEDEPAMMDLAAIKEAIGGGPPGAIARLEAAGLLERVDGRSNGPFRVMSPGLLDVITQLRQAGIDLDTIIAVASVLREQLALAIQELVPMLVARAGRGFGQSLDREELSKVIDALRPVSGEAVKLLFLRELELALRSRETLSIAGLQGVET